MTLRVDFYVLGEVPAERIVPTLAAKSLGAGERILLVSGDPGQRAALSDAMWQQDGFIAHGTQEENGAERQPILLAETLDAPNGAKSLCIADGEWREGADEGDRFARIFYLFGDAHRDAARQVWRNISAREDVEAFFWKQEDGKWRQGP